MTVKKPGSGKLSVANLFGLKGKVALVTGGNGGIGMAIAKGLAAAGADVVIAARDEAKTKAAVAELKKAFAVELVGVKLDVLDERNVKAAIKQVKDRFGRLDILVNNSGMAVNKLPHEMPTEDWDLNIATNLRSVFIVSKAAYPLLKASGGGKIINIGSMFAIFGAGSLPAYSASKGGVVQLTKSMAQAWAADNIQVNLIVPGFINTDLSAGGKRDIPGLEEGVRARTPAGRWGDPDDCLGAAIFLASRASDFVTGAAVNVDGGYSIM